MTIDQLGEPDQHPFTLGWMQLGPTAVLERLARLLDGKINVGGAASGDLGKGLAGRWIDRWKGFFDFALRKPPSINAVRGKVSPAATAPYSSRVNSSDMS